MKRTTVTSSLLAATAACLGAGLLGANPAAAITILDFETNFDGHNFTADNDVKAKYQFWENDNAPDLGDWYKESHGVTMSGWKFNGASRHLSLYDSESEGQDDDLLTNADLNSDLDGTTPQGNVLILQEGKNAAPDDNAGGGIFRFEFDNKIKAQSITMLDIGDGNPGFNEVTFKLFDSSGNEFSKTAEDFLSDQSSFEEIFKKDGDKPKDYDNSIYEFDLSKVFNGSISRIDVVNKGSGAIAGLKWHEEAPKVPEPISLLAPLTIGAIATGKALKKRKAA